MSILRKVNREHYTTIENDILEDERLSYRARGIAVYLLSKPDKWTINMKHLARNGKEGLGAIRTALHELAEHGYIKRTRQHTNGHVVTVTLIADFPAFAEDGTAEERINGYELTEQEPDVQEPDISKTDMSETDKSDPDMSETDRSLVNTDVVNTDVVNTDKEKNFPETATANNETANDPNPSEPKHDTDPELSAACKEAWGAVVYDMTSYLAPGEQRNIHELSYGYAYQNGEGPVIGVMVKDAGRVEWMRSRYGPQLANRLGIILKQTVSVEFAEP